MAKRGVRTQKARTAKLLPGGIHSILDGVEKVAGFIPGAVRGIRGIFGGGGGMGAVSAAAGSHEAEFATPASFAIVQNNITQQLPDERVDHPTLGIAGVKTRGSQPFARIAPVSLGPGKTFFRTTGGTAELFNGNIIPLNPISMGGPLSVKAALYQKFVFRKLRFLFTTVQTTTFVGMCALAIEPDLGAPITASFSTAREVVPNVTFPYRIPQACLNWAYNGPDTCFMKPADFAATAADLRQSYQGFLVGQDSEAVDAIGETTGFLDVEYEIDFFDPVPPNGFTAVSLSERLAVASVLRGMRRPQVIVPFAKGRTLEDTSWLKQLEDLGMAEPKDLMDEPAKATHEEEGIVVSRVEVSSAAAAVPKTVTSRSYGLF
jgi:hypothetical protein